MPLNKETKPNLNKNFGLFIAIYEYTYKDYTFYIFVDFKLLRIHIFVYIFFH